MPSQDSAHPTRPHSRQKLWLAFAAVFVIWGSTYLAIRYAVQTIPPYFMVGTRFLVSGVILFLWARWRGAPNPTQREWRDGGIVGLLLLCGGNGAVAWAEQRVPSGITALLVASVPLWIVIIDWLRPRGKKPHLIVAIGLVVGLAGVGVLALPGAMSANGEVEAAGAVMLLFGSISWAAGSIYSRHGARPQSAEMATALQMILGSVALLLVAGVAGEFAQFRPSAVSLPSFLGWAYLVTFGGLVGFTAYIYLLGATTPAKATTYAYVNPVVAVFLGWAIAGEPIVPRTILAATIILIGVAMITIAGGRDSASGREGPRENESLRGNA
jgi:drug/metabolite transporter (DMT)-like permease